MVIIDLFSGAGGLTEGFLKQGAKFIAHIEKEYWACETLKTRLIYHKLKGTKNENLYWEYCRRATNKDNAALRESIIYSQIDGLKNEIEEQVFNYTFGDKNYPVEEIIEKIRFNLSQTTEKKVSIIIGGPPCQAYSLAGRGRMKEKAAQDDRNFLFRYYIQIVKAFKPDFFVMENVPGILTARNGEVFEAIRDEFGAADVGYDFYTGLSKANSENIINTADFGVPQIRRRMLMLGVNRDIEFDHADFYNKLNLHKKRGEWLTAEEAISDLPRLSPGHGNDFWYCDKENLSSSYNYQRMMRKSSQGIMNHFARNHNQNDLAIYKLTLEEAIKGKTLQYYDLPDERKTHKNHHSFTDRYKVHVGNKTPHTIVAHIGKDGHYNIHFDASQLRSLTVREAARIQSFPDDFRFEGPRVAQFTQVGNAVPPILSDFVAQALNSAYYDKIKK